MPPAAPPPPIICAVAARKVIQACIANWDAHKADCSGFVKAVAAELGVRLGGQANDILKALAADWWPIPGGLAAAEYAGAGYLVVAGLAADPNGHVVVVVPGPLAHGKYPTAWWGQLGGVGKKAKTLNFSWNQSDRNKVGYWGMALRHTGEEPVPTLNLPTAGSKPPLRRRPAPPPTQPYRPPVPTTMFG